MLKIISDLTRYIFGEESCRRKRSRIIIESSLAINPLKRNSPDSTTTDRDSEEESDGSNMSNGVRSSITKIEQFLQRNDFDENKYEILSTLFESVNRFPEPFETSDICMRGIDRLVILNKILKYSEPTLHLSIHYLKKLFNLQKENNFEEVTLGCLHLASKYCEVHPTSIREVIEIFQLPVTPQRIFEIEREISKIVDFRYCPLLLIDLTDSLALYLKLSPKEYVLLCFLGEISIYTDTPSSTASKALASLYIVTTTCRNESVLSELELITLSATSLSELRSSACSLAAFACKFITTCKHRETLLKYNDYLSYFGWSEGIASQKASVLEILVSFGESRAIE